MCDSSWPHLPRRIARVARPKQSYRYVEAELRGYLRCGVFAHGFVRAHCDGWGHDVLVAFSCKARSVCPRSRAADEIRRSPPIALDRLRRLHDGRLAYRIKNLRDGHAKYRVIAPLEFMARLAALVPPPRYPLLRYHGVLAPRSPWRREIVPRPREIQSSRCSPAKRTSSELTRGHASTTRSPAHTSDRRTPPQRTEHRDSTIALRSPGVSSGLQIGCRTGIPVANSSAQTSTAVTSLAASWMSGFDVLAPNIVSVKHWNRLLGGQLYAASPRIDWARLLRRCFDVDVLNCPTCGGRLRVLSEVTDPTMIGLMLEALGLPTVAPRAARARDPTELGGESESI
jgi:hypothetical protein